MTETIVQVSEYCVWSAEQDRLGPAFELFLEHVKDPSKDAANPHFNSKFVSLGAAIEAIRPASHGYGIYIRQPIEGMGVATVIDHPASGQFRRTWAPLMLEKQTPQGMGSAITYLRRYSLLSALGLEGDVDDDAEAAEAPHRAEPKPPPVNEKKAIDRLVSSIAGATTKDGLGLVGQAIKDSGLSDKALKGLRSLYAGKSNELDMDEMEVTNE